MRETAKKLFEMPMKEGHLDPIETMQDVNGANITVEQAVLLRQMQAAMKGDTDAAAFLQAVIGEESDQSEDTAISEAAAAGDTYAMLTAMRDKLARLVDRTTNPREATALTRQLVEINDRIDKMNRDRENKEGENPLNVILLNRQKRAQRASGA